MSKFDLKKFLTEAKDDSADFKDRINTIELRINHTIEDLQKLIRDYDKSEEIFISPIPNSGVFKDTLKLMEKAKKEMARSNIR